MAVAGIGCESTTFQQPAALQLEPFSVSWNLGIPKSVGF
jgi:hypothetical protein